MNLAKLVEEGDAILHRRITEVGWPRDDMGYVALVNDLLADSQDMVEFLQAHGGVALAANQVGFNVRMFAFARFPLTGTEPPTYIVCVNPVILERSSIGVRGTEYCVNFPDIGFEISRPCRLVFTASNEDGVSFEHTVVGEAARAISQAMDLLDGITLFDIA